MNHPLSKIFKTENVRLRSLEMSPILWNIMLQMYFWADARSLPFVVTSTVSTEEEDKYLKRVSSSHREGRAFDLSDDGWSNQDKLNFEEEFERRFRGLGAISARTQAEDLILYHDNGNGFHFHIQIAKQYMAYS